MCSADRQARSEVDGIPVLMNELARLMLRDLSSSEPDRGFQPLFLRGLVRAIPVMRPGGRASRTSHDSHHGSSHAQESRGGRSRAHHPSGGPFCPAAGLRRKVDADLSWRG
jgi:hypothetical protein